MSGICWVIRFQIGESDAEEAEHMEKVSILKIRDKNEDQEALAIVRSVDGFVTLTLSLEHEGDVEVAFTPAECEELILRLRQARLDAEAEDGSFSKIEQASAELQPA